MDDLELAKELQEAWRLHCGDRHGQPKPTWEKSTQADHGDWIVIARRAKAWHAERDAELRRLAACL